MVGIVTYLVGEKAHFNFFGGSRRTSNVFINYY